MKVVLFIAALLIGGASHAAGVDDDRRVELNNLLKHDCGSCHGLRLEGGLGPPLTAPRMRQRSTAYLRAVIREGVPGTAMPPWGPLLSDRDIDYLADRLLEEKP